MNNFPNEPGHGYLISIGIIGGIGLILCLAILLGAR